MADDSLKINKLNNTVSSQVTSDNNQVKKQEENVSIHQAEKVGESSADKSLSNNITTKSTSQTDFQNSDNSILDDIDAMAEIPQDTSYLLSERGKILKTLTESISKLDKKNKDNIDKAVNKRLNSHLPYTEKYLTTDAEYVRILQNIIAYQDKLSEEELTDLLNSLSIKNDEEKQGKASYYLNKAIHGVEEVQKTQEKLTQDKYRNLEGVKANFQEITDNEGMVADLTNALISLFGTSRGDVKSAINVEDKNVQELIKCIATKDAKGFAVKYREITGVNFDIDKYKNLSVAQKTFESAEFAHTMQDAAKELRKELDRESYKLERNYNLDSCENYLRAKSPEYSPLEKALMKTFKNDKKACLLWIDAKKLELGLKDEPQYKIYGALVKEFFKDSKELSKEAFKDKSFEEYTSEYKNALKSVYGENIPEETLNNYISNQMTANGLTQTGLMIGVGILSGGSALAVALTTGALMTSEKMTSNKGLNLKEDAGDIAINMAITYGGWKVFGLVAKNTAEPLLKKLNDKAFQSLLETHGIKITTAARGISLTSAAAGGASSGVATSIVEGMIQGQDASTILSNSLKSGLSGALFAIVFAGGAELKNALTSPVKRFKADYKSILKELAKNPEHSEFLKSINGIENTPEGATKVVEYLTNMRKTTFFSSEDVELITQDTIPAKYADINPQNQPGYHIEVEKAFAYKYDSPALQKGVKLTSQEKALWDAIFKFENSFKQLVKDYYSIPRYARGKDDFKFVMQPELTDGSKASQTALELTKQPQKEEVVNPETVKTTISKTQNISSKTPIKTLEQTKEAEIAQIKKTIAEEKAMFIEAHKDNLPSLEERYEQLLRNLRISYAGGYSQLESKAEVLANNINRYLDYLWEISPRAKELKLQLALKKMTPEELDLYNRAVKRLDERGLKYDKYELVQFPIGDPKSVTSSLATHGFASGDFVIGCNSAYRINNSLRRGVEVNDLLRRL
ncbi:MAG: hypothetical protein MJ180_03345 [Candidatus Gastranaerophilales bacterium]|nr:hypothetical protein [Candidatus Gastranaerophilales bacterium]